MWSFPAAIKLPEKVKAPTAKAIPPVTIAKIPALVSTAARVKRAATAEAAPPKPLSKATVWGMVIISTFIVR